MPHPIIAMIIEYFEAKRNNEMNLICQQFYDGILPIVMTSCKLPERKKFERKIASGLYSFNYCSEFFAKFNFKLTIDHFAKVAKYAGIDKFEFEKCIAQFYYLGRVLPKSIRPTDFMFEER